MGIRDFVKAISPPWLIGPGTPSVPLPAAAGVAERFLYALSLGGDYLAQKVEDAIKMRFPGVGDPSALAQISDDRLIVRGFAESDVDYAARLRRWLTTWRYAGAARGVLEAVAGYIGVRPRVQSILDGALQSVWDVLSENAEPNATPDTYHVTPENWNWDNIEYVGRRWLVLDGTNISTGNLWVNANWFWGMGTWGMANMSLGMTSNSQVFSTIRSLVNSWRSAGTRYQWCVVNFDPTWYDHTLPPGDPLLPDASWETWSKIDASSARPVRVESRHVNSRFFNILPEVMV